MCFNGDKLIDHLKGFLLAHHDCDLKEILRQCSEDDHYSVNVSAVHLLEEESDVNVCNALLCQPRQLLAAFDQAILAAETALLQQFSDDGQMTVKRHVHARIMSLPVCPELLRSTVPRTADVSHFLSVVGSIVRITVIHVLEFKKEFICMKCKNVVIVEADLERYFKISKPDRCSNLLCKSTSFNSASEHAGPLHRKNYQEVKIQEQVQHLDVGKIPRSTWVLLEDDLVDCCQAGDEVTVSGLVCQRWHCMPGESTFDIEIVLRANHVLVSKDHRKHVQITLEMKDEISQFWRRHKDRPLSGRDRILASLCPQVYGLYIVKLAVALLMCRGTQRLDEDGSRIRGDLHLLLVGDPGTGKSQFLKYVAKVMPRSLLTTGIGSTSAGLTVAAVKDSGQWQLEAGALVLADGGICCIDEFSGIREHDKTSIHEAMEQQCISVAKAGLVCKLNTRTSILAATNPKGRYDPTQSLCINVALASPLLSRFDLVFVLLDSCCPDWDEAVSGYILHGSHLPADAGRSGGGGGVGGVNGDTLWSVEQMQAYFAMIQSLNPVMTEDASRVLQAYYCAQRRSDEGRSAARTSVRLLQSMIRLAQGHARLMFRDNILVQDAVIAVCLMECSMEGNQVMDGVDALHTTFPDNADYEYIAHEETVLTRLGLQQILQQTAVSSAAAMSEKRDWNIDKLLEAFHN